MNRLEAAFGSFPTSAPVNEDERRKRLMLEQALQAKAIAANGSMLSPDLPSQLTAPRPMADNLTPDRGSVAERISGALAKGDLPDAPPPARGVDTTGFGGSVPSYDVEQALRGAQGPGGNMLGKVPMPPELQGYQVGLGPNGPSATPYPPA